MKKIAAKLITISSQILVVSLFLVLLFSNKGANDKEVTISNNNFEKMADMTSFLFEEEKKMINVSSDDDVTVELENKTEEEKKDNNKVEDNKDVEKPVVTEQKPTENDDSSNENTSSVPLEQEILGTYVGNLTGYGADCYGCSGHTSSGFDLTKTMYYSDHEYGNVRILAADPSFPLYSIFRVSNVPGMDTFIGIVLDRGGNVGYGRGTLFDLAYTSESDPSLIGLVPNVTFELLRSGN